MSLRNVYVSEPLPGTEPPVRALFVERWGTLLERPERGCVSSFADAEFVPGAVDALFRAAQHGWTLYLVGNEEAVAPGPQSPGAGERFEQELLAHPAPQGVNCRPNYARLDRPGGRPGHDRDSVFLFPNTGTLYHAKQHDGVRLGASWLISDDDTTLAAGWRAGARVARVSSSGAPPPPCELDVEVHSDSSSLGEFVWGLISRERRVA